MRGGGGGMMEDDDRVGHAQIPTSFGHELRACLRRRLVKTYDQFRENGCENRPSTAPPPTSPGNSMLDASSHSAKFLQFCVTGALIGCSIACWGCGDSMLLEFRRFIPGCYTLAVSEELPEEYQGICQDNNVHYVPPKRV